MSGNFDDQEVLTINPSPNLHLQFWRWCRNSLVAAMLALGIAALVVAQEFEQLKLVIAAAIGAMAFASLELTGKPLDEKLCKLAPICLAGIVAWLALFVEAGEERDDLIKIVAITISVFLSVFGLQFMLAYCFPSIKWPHTR